MRPTNEEPDIPEASKPLSPSQIRKQAEAEHRKAAEIERMIEAKVALASRRILP